MISWSNFLANLISDFIDKGYNFNQIAEMHITRIANKLDVSYGFYIKYKMHAVEWKFNAMINKDKKMINNLNRDWKQPLNRKFESYRV